LKSYRDERKCRHGHDPVDAVRGSIRKVDRERLVRLAGRRAVQAVSPLASAGVRPVADTSFAA
jgi:hypothetical protein